MKNSISLSSLSMATILLIQSALPATPQEKPPASKAHAATGGFREPDPIAFNEHAGWTSMFDGSSLAGWDGDKAYWKVQDGAITVSSTCEKPTGTIYLIWQGGEPADFEMKLEMKGDGPQVNSGVQYRGAILPASPTNSRISPRSNGATCPSGAPQGIPPSKESQAKWDMLGAQFDFDGSNRYSGQYYEQATGRGIIAWRGQVVRTEHDKDPRLLATLGDREQLAGLIKKDDWNQLHIIARGAQMTHIINGHVMAILLDDDTPKFRKRGLIGIEIEGFGTISVRNIWIRKL